MTRTWADAFKYAALIGFSWLALLLSGATPAAAQQGFENLDRLDSIVAMTVGANIGQPGGPVAPIDRRLRLAPCPGSPKIEGPQFGAAIVSCPQTGWRLRVPLVPGADVAKSSDFSRPSQSQSAAPAPMIRKGDPVQLVAGDGSFSVVRPMIADEDGTIGAVIRVREGPRTTPVFGRIESLGIVRVPGI